jgi:penicillin G amidase
MDKDHPQPLIAWLSYQYLRKAVAERASPGNGEIYDGKFATSMVQKLLRERPRDWFGDYNQLLLQCLGDGIEEGQRMQGKDPKRWRWGKYMFLSVQNPVVTHVPVIGKYFDLGPVPMSGTSTSVKQTTRVLGPSERIDTALGDWDNSLFVLPIGESGQVASLHYRDEWKKYYNGEGFRMQYNKVESKGRLTFVPMH